jgi:hypothetical protein
LFIPYGFQVGYYVVKDAKHAKQEGKVQLEYRFMTGRFKKHDPKGLVLKHVEHVSLSWPYAHEKWQEELFIEGCSRLEGGREKESSPKYNFFCLLVS